MPAMTMVQALNSAMDVMLQRDRDVVIFGEDVGFYGGVFRVTPISEERILMFSGTECGMASGCEVFQYPFSNVEIVVGQRNKARWSCNTRLPDE